ncbi:MAG: translation elongation factor Ts [Rickettsiales bacterium]
MVEITASLVKELREKSGAGMMDCKKALIECAGVFEDAVDWLRKKGLSAAAKKSGREAAEGLVAIALKDNSAAIIELNAETDFVARNDKFQALSRAVAIIALNNNDKDVENLKTTKYSDSQSVADAIADHIAIIGENMNLRRVNHVSVSNGAIASYMHNAISEGLGKIGVLIALESTGDKAKLLDLGKRIAMHIAAARPESLDTSSVSPESLERERNIFADQARASGKPENIIEKMVEGRIKKFYQEVVLLEQIFVMDNKTPISQVLVEAAKEIGAPVTIKSFVRYELGEGIERTQSDFAAEVASMAK